MWTPKQQYRLAFERKLLEADMPQYQFYNHVGDTYVEGTPTLTSGAGRFRLRAELPSSYPLERPRLYVWAPRVLRKRGKPRTVNALGRSHAFHTQDNHVSGVVQICYADTWDPSMCLITVFLRGMLWLEAYEAHLRTGRDLAEFLA